MSLWVILLAVIPVSYVASIGELFPTAAGRQAYATVSAHNAGFVGVLLHSMGLSAALGYT